MYVHNIIHCGIPQHPPDFRLPGSSYALFYEYCYLCCCSFLFVVFLHCSMAVGTDSKEISANKLKDILSIQLEVRTIVLFYKSIMNDMWALPIHIQVTERLLEAEEHRLKLLKTEIEVARHKGGDAAVKPSKVCLSVCV